MLEKPSKNGYNPFLYAKVKINHHLTLAIESAKDA
jgi:hypothetical protein